MKKLLLLFAAAALCAAPAYASPVATEDHLEPVMTATQAAATGNKEASVELILFKEAFGQNVRARIRVFVLPGGYESMSFVTEERGAYHLDYLYSEHSIFAYAMPKLPMRGAPAPDPLKATVLRKEVEISPTLAHAIISDWKKLLLQTRYAIKHNRGYDGMRIELSMEDDAGAFAGQTWNPFDLPVLGTMTAVASDMTMACGYGPKAKDQCVVHDIGTLEKDVADLSKILAEHSP